jgi:hypothetical protein
MEKREKERGEMDGGHFRCSTVRMLSIPYMRRFWRDILP